MSPRTKPPRVVAELGRPETPQETADRKAQNSRNYRMRKTVNNLVFSLLVSVVLVVVIVFAVPRGEIPPRASVDWSQVASDSQPSRSEPLANPVLDEGWKANYAELRNGANTGVATWNIGLLTPKDPTEQFVGVTQAFSANETWLAQELKNTAASSSTVINGVTWTVYDNRESRDDVGNVEYALTTVAGTSTFIVFGTADPGLITEVAAAVAPQVMANTDAQIEGQNE